MEKSPQPAGGKKPCEKGWKAAHGWHLYMLAMLAFNIIVFLPPVFLSMGYGGIAHSLYEGLHPTCHQLDSRSLCYFPQGKQIIRDCVAEEEGLVFRRSEQIVSEGGGVGYKIGVCSRDVAIYLFMLIGAFFWPFYAKGKEAGGIWPKPIWLLLAMVPIALDGGTQILGWRESTNLLRIITGAIIGFVMPFYLIPVMNQLLNPLIGGILHKIRK